MSAVDRYLENKRNTNKLLEAASPVGKSGSNSQSKSVQQKQIEEKMNLIMNMVQANSQLVKVAGLFMNVKNRPVFIQLVHNTDDDTILLLFIAEFQKFRVTEIQLSGMDHPYWRLLEERAGYNNANIVGNAQTCITSCEFGVLIEDIVLARIAAIQKEQEDSERRNRRDVETLGSQNSSESIGANQAQESPPRKATLMPSVKAL